MGRVMNETRNFFLYGTAPPRGLDALDQLLIRKAEVMASCGDPRDFVIRAKNVSADLLCAMRVTLLNETEIDLIDNFGFNASEPITRENEALMLTTLTSSIKGLLGMHPTSADEDEALLDAEDLSPKQRQAVLLRKREKELLVSTLDFLRMETEELGSQDERNETESQGRYQIASLMEEERAKEERLEDLRRKLEEERERMNRTKVEVVTVTVNVRKAGQPGSAESANLTIHEGDSLVSKVAEFGAKHDLDAQGRAKLENHVKNAIAEEKPIAALVQAITRYGAIAVLGAREGDNVTDNVERFLLSQGLLEEGEDKFSDLLQEMERKLRSRVEARLLFQIPIVAPDGRKLGLQIRDGEQHDLPGFMRTFAQVRQRSLCSLTALLLTRHGTDFGELRIFRFTHFVSPVRHPSREQRPAVGPGGSEASGSRDTAGAGEPGWLEEARHEALRRRRGQARGSHLKLLRQERHPGGVHPTPTEATRPVQASSGGLLIVTAILYCTRFVYYAFLTKTRRVSLDPSRHGRNYPMPSFHLDLLWWSWEENPPPQALNRTFTRMTVKATYISTVVGKRLKNTKRYVYDSVFQYSDTKRATRRKPRKWHKM